MEKKKYYECQQEYMVQCGTYLNSSQDKGLKSRNVFGPLTDKVHLFKQLK